MTTATTETILASPTEIKPLRIAIIGIGNPLLSDDTIGLSLIDQIKLPRELDYLNIAMSKHYSNNIDLLYELEGKDKAIIIDSIQTKSMKPGDYTVFKLEDYTHSDINTLENPHTITLKDVIRIGQRLNINLPGEIILIGIEGEEFCEFCEAPTPKVGSCSSQVLQEIYQILDLWKGVCK